MKFRKLEFQGIRAFADKTTFRFGKTPGLYFLQGSENAVDTDLGSNGVGKSTIWAILCWVVFGKTPDGLKAGDIKSWNSDEKGYYAKLWLGRDIIKRTWKPNSLTINGEVVEQKELEQRIGISFATFVSSVVLAQGGDMFFDLAPPKKLAMFTSLLGLENWIEYSRQAKDAADAIDHDIQKVENGISRVSGSLDALDVEELQGRHTAFRTDKSTAITLARTRLKEFNHDFEQLDIRHDKSEETRKNLIKKVRRSLKKRDDSEQRLLKLRKALKKAKEDAREKVIVIRRLDDRLLYLEENKGLECSMCSQKITGKEVREQVAWLKKKLRITSDEAQPFTDKSAKLLIENDAESACLESASSYLNNLLKKQQKHNKIHAELEVDFNKVKTARDIAENRWREAQNNPNPYKELLRLAKAKETKLLEKLDAKRARLKKVKTKQVRVRYWVQGFKDIRLQLIKEALLQFEVETNRALSDLGLSDKWKIRYAIEKITKRGSSIPGFNVLIESPHTDKTVPFAAWSGGERQRLRIAGSMGFMSLITNRSGIDFGIEVFDEPTQHLSPEGIDSLLQALNNRAHQTRKRIWLVDHHTLDYGDFEGHTTVNKDEEGRSTIWQN